MADSKFARLARAVAVVAGMIVGAQCQKESSSGGAGAEPLAGIWQGTVATLGYSFGVAIHVGTEQGQPTVTLDAVHSRMLGFVAKNVVVDGRSVRFTMPGITFAGAVDDRGDLCGTWSGDLRKIDVRLRPTQAVVLPKRPQEPQQPLPYQVHEVAYHYLPAAGIQTLKGEPSQKSDAISFAARLTVPTGEGPHPAVVLVSGSGPDTRDASIMGHRLFLVLSDYLTRQGFAVLSYDERGCGESTGDFGTATLADLAMDVRAGVAFLGGRNEVDKDRVGLIGHSEGGMVAPMVATGPDAASIQFVVSLAGPAEAAEELLARQFRALRSLRGMQSSDIDLLDELFHSQCALLRNEPNPEKCHTQIGALVNDVWAKLTADGKGHLSNNVGNLMATTIRMRTPKSRAWLDHDVAAPLRKLTCPVLVLAGSKDLQVDADANLTAARIALKHNANATLRKLEGLNHLFQECTTGSYSEYATIEQTMSPTALQAIAEWLQAR